MRRIATLLTVAFGLWIVGVTPVAFAQDATPPAEAEEPEPPAVPGEPVCTITDYRLVELSGMVAIDAGYVVINDGSDFFDRRPLFFLDSDCNVVDQIQYPTLARDPEDLAIDHRDGTLWVGDTGDNNADGLANGEPRETVALWRVAPEGDRTPVIHRFVYPDGPRDAEALLLDGDGTPIIVTKRLGAAELYRPAEAPRPNNPPEEAVPLEKVGEFSPPPTSTEHPFGPIARQVITGAANSPDGSRVVLRTYTDAFEFDVADGDVVAAITDGEPRITPLPGEPQGEAITYTPDGQYFLTVSETAEHGEAVPAILRYTPTAPAPPPPPEEPPPPATGEDRSFFGRLFNPSSLQDYVNIIAAVGVLGVIMVGAGVFGIVRARRRAPSDEDAGEGVAPGGGARRAVPASGAAPVGTAVVGAASVGSAAVARATVPAAAGYDQGQSGWEPDVGREQRAGVYASSTAGYGGAEHAGAEYGSAGHNGTEYGGTEYGGGEYGGGGYQGGEYGGGGYQGGEYGGAEYSGGEYAGNEYGGGEYGGEYAYGRDDAHGAGQSEGWSAQAYPAQEYAAGYMQEYADQPYVGQGHAGQEQPGVDYHAQGYADGYQSDGEYGSDYDPDYPYEFRDPGLR